MGGSHRCIVCGLRSAQREVVRKGNLMGFPYYQAFNLSEVDAATVQKLYQICPGCGFRGEVLDEDFGIPKRDMRQFLEEEQSLIPGESESENLKAVATLFARAGLFKRAGIYMVYAALRATKDEKKAFYMDAAMALDHYRVQKKDFSPEFLLLMLDVFRRAALFSVVLDEFEKVQPCDSGLLTKLFAIEKELCLEQDAGEYQVHELLTMG